MDDAKRGINDGIHTAGDIAQIGADRSESGQYYGQGMRAFTSVMTGAFKAVFFVSAAFVGQKMINAQNYSNSWKEIGGNGFVATPAYKTKDRNERLLLSGFNGNKGFVNLQNQARRFGDSVASIALSGSGAQLKELETILIRNNIAFCNRTAGTLKFRLNSTELPADITKKLKKHGIASDSVVFSEGVLTIENIEHADAECFMHEIFKDHLDARHQLHKNIGTICKGAGIDEPWKVIGFDKGDWDALLSNKTNLTFDQVESLRTFVNSSAFEEFAKRTPSMSLDDAKVLCEKVSVYGNGLPLDFSDTGKGSFANMQISDDKDGFGFTNFIGEKRMPVTFECMGKDKSNFEKCVNISDCSIGSHGFSQGGQLPLQDFQKVINRSNQYDFKLDHINDFKDFMATKMPDTPFCIIGEGTANPTVHIPSALFKLIDAGFKAFCPDAQLDMDRGFSQEQVFNDGFGGF